MIMTICDRSKAWVASSVAPQYVMPIDNPPATEASNPIKDTPPLVPRGTERRVVINRGSPLLKTPSCAYRSIAIVRSLERAGACERASEPPMPTCLRCNTHNAPPRRRSRTMANSAQRTTLRCHRRPTRCCHGSRTDSRSVAALASSRTSRSMLHSP